MLYMLNINNKWCKVYMDDILIFATTLEELRTRTLQVLEVLLKHDLYLKPEKYEFEKKEVDYLGYVISHNKIAMDPKKLARISEWPAPKNIRQVQSFLGFRNFYWQFIKRFSHTVKPLTNLTKKGLTFEWTQQCEEAFRKLKQRFLEAPILVMPDQDQPFFVETNASAFASGGVLMQKDSNCHEPSHFALTFRHSASTLCGTPPTTRGVRSALFSIPFVHVFTHDLFVSPSVSHCSVKVQSLPLFLNGTMFPLCHYDIIPFWHYSYIVYIL